MLGHTPENMHAKGPCFRVWRTGDIGYLQLFGMIDDVGAAEWVGALEADIELHGAPKYVLVDMHAIDSQSSLKSRMRTAMAIRRMLSKMRFACAHVGVATSASIVARVVLRVVGMGNCALVGSEAALARAEASFQSGKIPDRTMLDEAATV